MAPMSSVNEVRKLDIETLLIRKMQGGVLMCSPEYFDVIDVKNYFMQGAVGSVDKGRAMTEWGAAKKLFEKLGIRVEIIDGIYGVEDMVFAANAGITWEDEGGKRIFLASSMLHVSRQRETPYYKTWFREHGYRVETLTGTSGTVFEGGGDALWHPEKHLLFGGYGHRSTTMAYEEIATRWNMPVVMLRLASKEFYHLDTALCLLDKATIIYCPDAFDDVGNAILEHLFPRRIVITAHEGIEYFTGNAFAVSYKKTLVLQKGNKDIMGEIQAIGWQIAEIDLGEFMKSGGNISCIKIDMY